MYSVFSEISPLKKVILHRPNLSLRYLTPSNCQSLLFDDVLWVDKANEEHRAFSLSLTKEGVEVFLLHDLMAETLLINHAKEWLLAKIFNAISLPPSMTQLVLEYLTHLDIKKLSMYLLGGLTLHDLSDPTLKKQLQPYFYQHNDKDINHFILAPLPNHLFTRDTSCWIGNGLSINPMHYPARQRETYNMAAIYKFHPMFKNSEFDIWYDGSNEKDNLPSIEGGDVLVISNKCLLIGLSQRTSLQAISLLAKKLLSIEKFEKIIAVDIPKQRASMHLDTLFTMVNYNTFCSALPSEAFRAWSIALGDSKDALIINQEKDFFTYLARSLGEKKLHIIPLAGDIFTQQREQWNDASNVLTIAPGKILAYEQNTEMNKKLLSLGLDVIEIAGSELGRGRGGARCMSCPIEREIT
ncbi:arginine deiminase [uncultured Shewanella sp.]|uniref:arginine deiminase n=1 Tax=uncultured Shewanella sp. TaxID=173975 RepID=UPI002601DC79|nr:arginine deiminase [uncultured Shewanella sp.]